MRIRRIVRDARRWLAPSIIIVLATGSPVLARTEIELWHGQPGANGQRLVELTQRFNAQDSEYAVKPLFNRAGGNPLPAVIAAYRAKRPPHLALLSDSATQVMLQSGAIVPVARLLREHGGVLEGGSFLEPVKACFVKDTLLHALPLSPGMQLLYYNKDIFRRAGLDPSRAPSTFDEIETAATRVVATRAARCGFTAAWPAPVFEALHAWHAQPLADQQDGIAGLSTTLLFNGDFATRLWETLARWQRAGLYTYGGRGRNAELLFTGGQCAIAISGTGLTGALDTGPFDWGLGPLPGLAGYPKGSAVVQGSALWVMHGREPAEYRGVVRFLEFVSRGDVQAWWHRATGYLPASHEVVRRLRSEGWFARRPDFAIALAQLSGSEGPGAARCFRVGNLTAIRDAVESELETVLAGGKTVKRGLDDAVRRGNDFLKEFADTYR